MRVAHKLLLAIFGVALALVVGFAILRVTGGDALLSPCITEPGEWLQQAGALLHDYRQPCETFYWLPDPDGEFHNRIQLDNFGLQDTTLTLARPDGVYRVLVVGDSFAQGWQVPLEQGFPYLVEQELSRASGRQVEVINLSVDAYGTDRELLLYSLLGWRFQPDLVLLAIYTGNDVQDNEIDLETLRYGYRLERAFFTLENGALQLHNSPVFGSRDEDAPAYQWLLSMQAAQGPIPPNNLPAAPRVVSQNPYVIEYPVELGLYLPEDEHWSKAWSLTRALIAQFRDLAQAENSRFAAVIIPDRRAVHTEDWDVTVQQYPFLHGIDPVAPEMRMDSLLADLDILHLNLTWNLRAWVTQNPGGRLYYGGDGHFNASGHSVTAQRLSLWLRAEGLVP